MTTTPNTAVWDRLKRPPAEQLKSFTRGGGFKGTAVRPMWTIHKMTQEFGACGEGWGINDPSFQIVQGHNSEVMVYCTVSIWHGKPGNKVYGVGGDKVVSYIKANDQYKRPERWENDDEAFKKAFTDAVTNALKHLGAAADIHMNLWDGSKYVTPADPDMPDEESSVDKKSKANARPDYTKLEAGLRAIRDAGTLDDLKLFLSDNKTLINSLPDEWYTMLMDEKDAVKTALSAKVAA